MARKEISSDAYWTRFALKHGQAAAEAAQIHQFEQEGRSTRRNSKNPEGDAMDIANRTQGWKRSFANMRKAQGRSPSSTSTSTSTASKKTITGDVIKSRYRRIANGGDVPGEPIKKLGGRYKAISDNARRSVNKAMRGSSASTSTSTSTSTSRKRNPTFRRSV